MRATQRLARTSDGRLVLDTHPDAAVLAYAVGDELSAEDAAALQDTSPAGHEQEEAAPPRAKRGTTAADKSRRAAGDKDG